MKSQPLISFDHVSKHYGETTALADFTLDIHPGEFLTVIGSSGGGKTTMLKMINGLILPTSGKVTVLGQDVAHTDLIALRRQIGYVIQGAALFPHLTVAKNIGYVPSLQGRKLPKERLLALMQLVDLDPALLSRHPASLSGGQQQRVGIARALADEPKLILMDEPFGAVDELTRGVLQDEIQKIHRQLGATIVFVTHDIQEAVKLGTQLLVVNQGRLEQCDTPLAVQENPANVYVDKIVNNR